MTKMVSQLLTEFELKSEQKDQMNSDDLVGFDVSNSFRQFNQMNDMFTRAYWDVSIKSPDTEAFFNSYRTDFIPRRGEGFNQKDFSLRNASWLISDIISNRGGERGLREGFQAAIE
ncbi:MAG: hypothetical protein HOO03_06705, partial [Rhodobacteraceae bacterium]|nr:hypothetical protein [Paracoccaceae bacterium]